MGLCGSLFQSSHQLQDKLKDRLKLVQITFQVIHTIHKEEIDSHISLIKSYFIDPRLNTFNRSLKFNWNKLDKKMIFQSNHIKLIKYIQEYDKFKTEKI